MQNNAAHRVIDEVELDAKSRIRTHFAMPLLTEAVAPTNNLVTNPDALAKAVQTRGQSLVAGARNPTLVLTGGKDPIVPPINARILGARIRTRRCT